MYRLKTEDINGTISYSNIVTLSYGTAQAANNPVILYPNPASGQINLSINLQSVLTDGGNPVSSSAINIYGVKIISQRGEVVKSATITQTQWHTNIAGLLPGTYILQVTDNSKNVFIGKTTFVKL
jgi:hypothetical protein